MYRNVNGNALYLKKINAIRARERTSHREFVSTFVFYFHVNIEKNIQTKETGFGFSIQLDGWKLILSGYRLVDAEFFFLSLSPFCIFFLVTSNNVLDIEMRDTKTFMSNLLFIPNKIESFDSNAKRTIFRVFKSTKHYTIYIFYTYMFSLMYTFACVNHEYFIYKYRRTHDWCHLSFDLMVFSFSQVAHFLSHSLSISFAYPFLYMSIFVFQARYFLGIF